MSLINPIFGILGLSGSIFVLLGAIFMRFPPKKINYFVGYRTRQSMHDQERWNFAQVYSSKQMILIGGSFLILSLLSLFVDVPHAPSVLVASAVLILGVLYILIRTEKALRRKFGKNSSTEKLGA